MVKPIKNDKQYEDALAHAYTLMQKDLSVDSKESDELEVLSILIKEYENEFYAVQNSSGRISDSDPQVRWDL